MIHKLLSIPAISGLWMVSRLISYITPLRAYFSDVSNFGLWAISIFLCFSRLVEHVENTRRNRWGFAIICTVLFAMGFIGSRDNRLVFEGVNANIEKMPESVATEVVNKLGGQKKRSFKFKREDFVPTLNKDLPFKGNGIVSLALMNNSEKTISDYSVDIALTGCEITSINARWTPSSMTYKGVNLKALTYDVSPHSGDMSTNPRRSKLFPDIENDCGRSVSGKIVIAVSMPDYLPFVYEFAYKFPNNAL